MQWLMLLFWGTLAFFGGRTKMRALLVSMLITAGLIVSMASQLWLLKLDGQLTLSTGLPLHLCGLFGVLSIPLLWRTTRWLFEASLLLGAPCAFFALVYPAVISSSQPVLMQVAFYRLHVLIVCTPLLLLMRGEALPKDPRRTFILANGYLLLVSLLNHLLHTNYLFLRAAPIGTPLAILFERGSAFYIFSLELLGMLLMTWLAHGFRRVARLRASALIPKNT